MATVAHPSKQHPLRRVAIGVAAAATLVLSVPPEAHAAAGVVGSGSDIASCGQVASPNRAVVLRMQCDGNLVLVHPGNKAVWSSATAGQLDAIASMQTDGNLVVYGRGHVARWSSGTGGNRGAVLAVQDDGNAVIVAPGNRSVWSTRTVIGSTASGNGQQSLTSRVAALTNAERARAGCGPLRTDGNLTIAAQRHAQDMAVKNYLSHTAPAAPRTMVDRLRAANVTYRKAAENIATGAVNDPADVVRRWMNSPGHRKNILDCSLGRIGVGYDTRSGGRWVQDFAD